MGWYRLGVTLLARLGQHHVDAAPVAAVVLVAALWLIPHGERTSRAGRKFDMPGALAITGAMLLLVYTVVSACWSR